VVERSEIRSGFCAKNSKGRRSWERVLRDAIGEEDKAVRMEVKRSVVATRGSSRVDAPDLTEEFGACRLFKGTISQADGDVSQVW
jgi:hypothetical protein